MRVCWHCCHRWGCSLPTGVSLVCPQPAQPSSGPLLHPPGSAPQPSSLDQLTLCSLPKAVTRWTFWKMTPTGAGKPPWRTTPRSAQGCGPRQRSSPSPQGSRSPSRRPPFAFARCIATSLSTKSWPWSVPGTPRQVQSFAERIVLFILNVVVLGRLERRLDDDDNMFFLPFSWKEEAKVLWRDGAAVGFYTTKAKGSLCGDGTGACYLLPVFDTVFVRRGHRRRGLGMAMLWDFCETFREDGALGVSWPISPAMLQVCRKFLSAHPEERGRLWEVEPPGAWGQRDSIWLKVQLRQSRLPDRRAALPGNPAEDGSSPGQTSQDDGPRQSRSGEGSQERIGGEEPEEAKEDQDCAVGEAAAELPGRRCRAELDGKRA
ncbi:protein FAM169B-like isoform X3 [Phyllostomus hastatus]|uniref:protein FAM169B-like isoform X3 n=1 Tax=Phyllostomus hastatus TaxID=9423 RepID=UPI001E683EE1|nr:protein FAM169B-like isoform X3 [Phyllostomus hastatus]